jgi:hypothetical protein
MKYYYISYYSNHLYYPDHPYFTLKLDHKPTYEEIIKNKPDYELDGYCIKYRYETTIEGELLVSSWKAEQIFQYFEKE